MVEFRGAKVRFFACLWELRELLEIGLSLFQKGVFALLGFLSKVI